jgi:hypothetical protein
VEERNCPRVCLFIDVRNVVQIYQEGTMCLEKEMGRQNFFYMVKRNMHSEAFVFGMNKRFFLRAFDKKNVV